MIIHCILTKVFVDKNDNTHIENVLFLDKKKAMLELESMKDDIKAKVAFKYGVPFDEFNINDFSYEVVDTPISFVYKDFEGDTNIKLEIQSVIPKV